MYVWTYTVYVCIFLQFACTGEHHSEIEERWRVNQMGLTDADTEPTRRILTVVKFCVIYTSARCFDMEKRERDRLHFTLINLKKPDQRPFFGIKLCF